MSTDSGRKTVRARYRRGTSTSFAANGGSPPQENVRSCAYVPKTESYCTMGDPQICPVRTSFFNLFFLSTLRAGDDTRGFHSFYPLSYRTLLRPFLKPILVRVLTKFSPIASSAHTSSTIVSLLYSLHKHKNFRPMIRTLECRWPQLVQGPINTSAMLG